jgi:hypothetical protein
MAGVLDSAPMHYIFLPLVDSLGWIWWPLGIAVFAFFVFVFYKKIKSGLSFATWIGRKGLFAVTHVPVVGKWVALLIKNYWDIMIGHLGSANYDLSTLDWKAIGRLFHVDPAPNPLQRVVQVPDKRGHVLPRADATLLPISEQELEVTAGRYISVDRHPDSTLKARPAGLGMTAEEVVKRFGKRRQGPLVRTAWLKESDTPSAIPLPPFRAVSRLGCDDFAEDAEPEKRRLWFNPSAFLTQHEADFELFRVLGSLTATI